jgi:biofilm protein TabA
MILDRIENLRQYGSLHPGIARAAAFVEANDLLQLAVGKHAIDEARLYVVRDLSTGKTLQGARLEAHRKYIDIQVALDRAELIGYSPLAACGQVSKPYDDARDIEFFAGAPQTWLTVAKGSFAVFFPADAHAPLAIDGQIHKAIFKVLV